MGMESGLEHCLAFRVLANIINYDCWRGWSSLGVGSLWNSVAAFQARQFSARTSGRIKLFSGNVEYVFTLW